jgi:hypothetical protein
VCRQNRGHSVHNFAVAKSAWHSKRQRTTFATLAGLYGRGARGPISGITLIAGFASTSLRVVHPLVSARLAALLHPVGAVVLGLLGPDAITGCVVLAMAC